MLLSFDAIPTEYFYPQIFGFADETPFADQFAELGYESKYVITNLGSLFMILVLYPVTIALLFAISRLQISPHRRINDWAKRSLDSFFWNDLITLINEPYQVLAVAAFIHSHAMFRPNPTGAEVFQDVFNLLLLGIVLVYPFVILWIYCRKMKGNQPDFRLMTLLADRDYCENLNKTDP